MRHRVPTAAFVAAALFVLSGFAGVAGAEPGPNGHNDWGLCKAYFAGSDTGQEHKRNAPPFVALEMAADAMGDGNGEASEEEVREFCDATTPGGK